MKTVFESSLAVDAHMVLHLLQQGGLQGQVLGDFLPGGAGDLPAAGLVRVVVADEHEAEARNLIADWERSQPPDVIPTVPKVSRRSTGITFAVGALTGAMIMWWACR
jgi:hypothetical protein